MLVAIKNLKLKSSLPRGELNSLTFQNSGLKICLSTLELYIPNPRLLSVYMARACKEVKLVLRTNAVFLPGQILSGVMIPENSWRMPYKPHWYLHWLRLGLNLHSSRCSPFWHRLRKYTGNRVKIAIFASRPLLPSPFMPFLSFLQLYTLHFSVPPVSQFILVCLMVFISHCSSPVKE